MSVDNGLFNGNFASLRRLSLTGISIGLPWKNLAKLQVLILDPCTPGCDIGQILDFFESAPLLHTIKLWDSISSQSHVSPERIVPLPCLRTLHIDTEIVHSILLNHLSIPPGVSLVQRFRYRGKKSPLVDYLPKTLANLKNLSHITTIDFRFSSDRKFLRLAGPSGKLFTFAYWVDHATLQNS